MIRHESSLTLRHARRALTAGAALLAGAVALAGAPRDASATWTCQTIDGNGGGAGRTSSSIRNVTAATTWLGISFAFYQSYEGVAGGTDWHLRASQDLSLFENYTSGNYDNGAIIADPSAGDPSVWQSQLWVPYINDDGNVFVAHVGIDGIWHTGVISLAGSLSGTRPTSVVFDNKLHIFFMGQNRILRRAVLDGTTTTFDTINNIAVENPRAIIDGDGKIRVFYHDLGSDNLRQALSADGANFSISQIAVTGDVGQWSAAVAKAPSGIEPSKLWVFYRDDTNEDLRVATSVGGGAFSDDPVDSGSDDMGYYPSAVLHNGVPKVYYSGVNGSDVVVREARLSGSSWIQTTLDGASGSNACSGAISGNYMTMPAATIAGSGSPRVYYLNNSDRSMRMATFSP